MRHMLENDWRRIINMKKDKQITIPIEKGDIRLFQELVYYDREPFEWRFDGVRIKFIKEKEEE